MVARLSKYSSLGGSLSTDMAAMMIEGLSPHQILYPERKEGDILQRPVVEDEES
jgi:hypothetical protein